MNTKPRIVCAALSSVTGALVVGIRHYSEDMLYQIEQRCDGEDFKCLRGDDQGFVDQYGHYYTRDLAYNVAKAAGQIIREEACSIQFGVKQLYSEALY